MEMDERKLRILQAIIDDYTNDNPPTKRAAEQTAQGGGQERKIFELSDTQYTHEISQGLSSGIAPFSFS